MKKIAAVAVVLVAVAGIVWWLLPNDTRRIRKLLAEVSETASVQANANALVKVAGARKLAGYFTPDVMIQLEGAGLGNRIIQGREELIETVAALRASVQDVKVEFLDVNLLVDSRQGTASAHFTALATVSGATDPYVQEIELRLVKGGDGWKISKVEPVKAVRLE